MLEARAHKNRQLDFGKFETGWDLLSVLKIVTHTGHAV